MPPDTAGKNLEKKVLQRSKGDMNISQHLRHDPIHEYPYQRINLKSAVVMVY